MRRCSVASRVRCGLDMSITINKDRGTCRDMSDGERGEHSERRTLIQRVMTSALALMLAMSIQRVANCEWRMASGEPLAAMKSEASSSSRHRNGMVIGQLWGQCGLLAARCRTRRLPSTTSYGRRTRNHFWHAHEVDIVDPALTSRRMEPPPPNLYTPTGMSC